MNLLLLVISAGQQHHVKPNNSEAEPNVNVPHSMTAVQLDAPAPYDPVWLASVEQYGPLPAFNETRLWGWVYETDVEFRLFTRGNPHEYQVLTINDSASLHNSLFNYDNKVKILTHGWLNHGNSPMPMSIKQAYLNVSDINIIVVDWGIAANVNYILASYNVAMVGRLLTQFLNFLIEEGVSMDDMHLIGHSLGAHVVGIAGAFVKKGPIDTITGLDPAYPLFTLGNKDARLDKHDARHVEVIHTCGGYLGFREPLGHIDFYPNGGTRQPGCGWDIRGLCAHNRAHMFFAESIVSDVPFTAVRCESYDELYYTGSCRGTGETLLMGGFDIHYGKDGIYYLKTAAQSPYALGDPPYDDRTKLNNDTDKSLLTGPMADGAERFSNGHHEPEKVALAGLPQDGPMIWSMSREAAG